MRFTSIKHDVRSSTAIEERVAYGQGRFHSQVRTFPMWAVPDELEVVLSANDGGTVIWG